ncbi:MAG: thioredoxin family protein [Candidatus Pacebacteria bacterium]|nr:thioredoxin family protein [Candidatus Paceibacterota bacterium]NUQ57567.1 thioredoxin family protein [Candidatus Paceibacter sp.]
MLKITLIRPNGCAHCVSVKKAIEKLKTDYPELVLEEVDMFSKEGMELVQKHHILSSPGILINEEFFAMGGATEEQLRNKIEELRKIKK